MDPASSSDDDDSSSSNKRGGSKEEDDYTRARRRAEIEPVDSDEDDGSSDDGEYNNYEDDDGDLQDLQDIQDIQQLQDGIANFDDLPTDDSEDDSDSSDSSSSDGDAKQRAKSYNSEEEEEEESSDEDEQQEEDVPISERVASKAQLGRRYYTGDDNTNTADNNDISFDESGKKRRAERKSRAIERLREVLKKDKKKKQSSTTSHSSDDDNSDNVEQAASKEDTNTTITTTKKKSKHAPTEMSSKRRDYFSRGRPDLNSSGIGISIGANKYKARDPRMTSLSGHLDDNIFDKRYSFLEEVQENEIKQLKLRINAWKQSGKKGQRLRKKLGINANSTNGDSLDVDQEELTNLLQQRAERKRSQVVRSAKKIVKQKIQEDVASGKRGAYYPKRSELKKMEAEAKYMEIRKRGGEEAVDKAIAKRRKKNMSKVAKSMPNI